MHRITLILILFLLLPDMYIYLVYIVKKTRNIVWRSTYWLPTAMLVAIYMYYIYMTGIMPFHIIRKASAGWQWP